MDANIIGFGGMAAMIIGFAYWNYTQNKEHAKALADIAAQQAVLKTAADAAWAVSNLNPSSPNFDPAAKAAADAARAAEEAAWAQDPRNPDSPNYDPNLE
jgi:DNA polymerase III alpha subunit